jgi:hypothetical protein
VEQWLSHWTGYVEETVFDVNMLIIDPKNVIVFNYNKLTFVFNWNRNTCPRMLDIFIVTDLAIG